MSGHLCLKWNNHSTAFLNSISKIHSLDKPRYCDATIVSQGKYFPVHRIVLSTCSDYFEELFERMECQHPYIVFKDIEPKDMELLLNYMYQGEVNVVQENLPNLIKAAEALRIKGLAVPDDMPSNKESSGKKRSSTSNGHPTPKRRAEERRKRDSSYSSHSEIHEGDDFARSGGVSDSSDKEIRFQPQEIEVDEIKKIKEEPVDPENFNSGVAPGNFRAVSSSEPPEASSVPGESNTADGDFSFPSTGEPSSYIKMENEGSIEGSFDQLSSSWSDLGGGDSLSQPLPAEAMTGQDDMLNGTNDPGSSSHTRMDNWDTVEYNHENGHHNSPLNVAFGTENVPKGTLRCPLCSYSSFYKCNVMRHIRFKHTNERRYSCTLCAQRFVTSTSLKRHYSVHTGEKPFPCPRCPRKYSDRNRFAIHMRSKHPK